MSMNTAAKSLTQVLLSNNNLSLTGNGNESGITNKQPHTTNAILDFLVKVVKVDEHGSPLNNQPKNLLDKTKITSLYCKRVLFPAIQQMTQSILKTCFNGTDPTSSLPIDDIRVIYTAIEVLWLMAIEPKISALIEAASTSSDSTGTSPGQPQKPATFVLSTPKIMVIDDQIVKELMRTDGGGFIASLTCFTWQEITEVMLCLEDLCSHPLVCQMILPRNISRFLLVYFVEMHLSRCEESSKSYGLTQPHSVYKTNYMRFISLLSDPTKLRRYESQQLIDKSIIIKSLRQFTSHKAIWVRTMATTNMTDILLSEMGLVHVILGYLEDMVDSGHFQNIQVQLSKIIVSIPKPMTQEEYFRKLCPQIIDIFYFYAIRHSNSIYQEELDACLSPQTQQQGAAIATTTRRHKRLDQPEGAAESTGPTAADKRKVQDNKQSQVLMVSTISLIISRIAQLYPEIMTSMILVPLAEPLLALTSGQSVSSTSLYNRYPNKALGSSNVKSIQTLSSGQQLSECIHVLHNIVMFSPVFTPLMAAFLQSHVTLTLLHLLFGLNTKILQLTSSNDVVNDDHRDALLIWMLTEVEEMLQKLFTISLDQAVTILIVFLGERSLLDSPTKATLMFKTLQGPIALLQPYILKIDRTLSLSLSNSLSLIDNNAGNIKSDQKSNSITNLIREVKASRFLNENDTSHDDNDHSLLTEMTERLGLPLQLVLQFLRKYEEPLYFDNDLSEDVGMKSVTSNTHGSSSNNVKGDSKAKDTKKWNLRGLGCKLFVESLRVYFNQTSLASSSSPDSVLIEERAFYGVISITLQSELPWNMLLFEGSNVLRLLADVVSAAVQAYLQGQHDPSMNDIDVSPSLNQTSVNVPTTTSTKTSGLIQDLDSDAESSSSSNLDILILALPLIRESLTVIKQEHPDYKVSDYNDITKRVRDEVEMLLLHIHNRHGFSTIESSNTEIVKLIDEGNHVVAAIVEFCLNKNWFDKSSKGSSSSESLETCKSAREVFEFVQREHFMTIQESSDMAAVILAYGLRELQKGLERFSNDDVESIVANLLIKVIPFVCTNDSFLYLNTIRFMIFLVKKVGFTYRLQLLAFYIKIFGCDNMAIQQSDLLGIQVDALLESASKGIVPNLSSSAQEDGLQLIASKARLRVMLGEVLIQVFGDLNVKLFGAISPESILTPSALALALLLETIKLAKYNQQFVQVTTSDGVGKCFDAFSGKRISDVAPVTTGQTTHESQVAESSYSEDDVKRLDELYLRQSALSLMSVLIPVLPIADIQHYIGDVLNISQGIVEFEHSYHPIARACRRSAMALMKHLLENYHEHFFVHHGHEGFEYLTEILRFLKKIHNNGVEKDEVVKFQVEKSLKIIVELAQHYLIPVDQAPDILKIVK